MPWNQSNGGGPWGGGGGGGGGRGPWGQGPGGPGNRPQPPNLDDLIRQGQDRLRDVVPPGRGGRLIWLALLFAAIVAYAFQCTYRVQADEVGVELRFGELYEITQPGLHFIVWPIDTVEKVPVSKENQENIGSRLGFSRTGGAVRRDADGESLMLSGDQNIVDVQFTVLWRINDPADFVFNVRDPRELVRIVAESAMREHVGQTRADVIRTSGRQEAQDVVRALTQETLDQYQAGIDIRGVRLEKADPPPAVIDAFEEVQRAQQDQVKFVEEARRYANKKLGQARGEASQILERSKGYKERVVAEAQGEAARFESVFEEYAKAKDVTRKRMFLETMEKVLGRSNKVIVEQGTGGDSGVVPYLPLNELNRNRAAN